MKSATITLDLMSKSSLIMVSVQCILRKSSYEANYDPIICIGELIRNLCVNLNIDPDTREGITCNIRVFRMVHSAEEKHFVVWVYDPQSSLEEVLTQDEISEKLLSLSFEVCDAATVT